MKNKKNLLFSLITLFISFSVTNLQAATITPNITTDPALGGSDCSLRYAIESINDGVTYEGDCMNFAQGNLGTDDTVILGPNTYVLELAGNGMGNNAGDLDAQEDIIIMGAGADQTTIDASGISDGDRIIQYDDVENASLIGLRLTGGDLSNAGGEGGAIRSNFGNLTLVDVLIDGNDSAGNGGGIFYDGDTDQQMNIENSTLDDNMALDGCGGGIYIDCCGNSRVAIRNSTISRNMAPSSVGGGICDDGWMLFLTNSTVSTNTAGSNGGGIFTSGGLKGAYNVTITLNEATGDQREGGGVYNDNNGQLDPRFTATVFNTIISDNTADIGPDCSGDFLTGGHNFIGDIGAPDVCNDFIDTMNGDQVGSSGSPLDAMLLGLAFNGGPNALVETHALPMDSLAVDRGNPNGCQALDTADFFANDPPVLPFLDLTTDERLLTRPIAILDPNDPICDIGAFELQTFIFEVTKDDGLGGATIGVGTGFTYTIVLTNNGPSDAGQVTLNDPLPSEVSFESLTTSQGTCDEDGGVVSCDLGDVPSGTVITITITVTATSTGTAVNTVTVTTSAGDFQASETTQIVDSNFLQGSGTLFSCSIRPAQKSHGPLGALPAVALLAFLTGLVIWDQSRRSSVFRHHQR